MSYDLTSQSEPVTPEGFPLYLPESPWKMLGPATTGSPVFPLSTTSASEYDCPSETTRSRLAVPDPGQGTPEIVSAQSAGSDPNATFESLPFHATTLRSFDGIPSL